MFYWNLLVLGIAVASFAGWLYALYASQRTVRGVASLDRLPLRTREQWPTVSVIMPACNEAATIGESLGSLLAQDYENLHVVAVNDRSTDETGAIIDRRALGDPRITALHVSELPEAWLGKVHALHLGTKMARGTWLLFADADVHFGKEALKRAVEYAEVNDLDSLTALPDVLPMGLLADAVYAAAGSLLCAGGRWAEVRDPRSSAFAGIGAFILVRRAALERSPGFEWLRLEVADDMGLGLLIKQHGGRCDVVNGVGVMQLHFYSSFADMAAKMQKNYFGIMARFSALRAAVLAAFLVGSSLFPLVLCAAPGRPLVWALVGAGWLSLLGTSLTFARWARRAWLPCLLIQVGLVLVAYLMVRSTILGMRMGGITWRGQLYPTTLLAAAQRVRI